MSKHTQGKWHYFKYPDTKTFTVAATGSIASKIRSEADAQLISAAPDLLEALKSVYLQLVVSFLKDGVEFDTAKIVAAIAKAEGELL